MEKLKKTVCVLLAILMLCGASAMAVHAQEEQTPDEDKLLQAFINYLDENNIGHGFPGEEMAYVKFKTHSNEWTIFFGFPGLMGPMPVSDQIGKYVFFSMNYHIPYKLGLYAEKDGVVLTLKEAYEAGKIDIDEVVNSGKFTAYLIGDINTDGIVNIMDVLMVQKVIAKTIDGSIGEFDPNARLCDYNGDGEITLEDVLAMQNAIAKIA